MRSKEANFNLFKYIWLVGFSIRNSLTRIAHIQSSVFTIKPIRTCRNLNYNSLENWCLSMIVYARLVTFLVSLDFLEPYWHVIFRKKNNIKWVPMTVEKQYDRDNHLYQCLNCGNMEAGLWIETCLPCVVLSSNLPFTKV